MLQSALANYKDIYQYVYLYVFPEIYSTTEKRGIDLKSNFHIIFKSCHDKKKIQQQQLAKQVANYENNNEQDREECEFEQKPIKNFDKLSDGEEEEFKRRAEKRNADRREQKQALKAKKLKINQEEDKANESQMWERLDALNNKFKTIKQAKKEETKKMSATIL